MKSITSLNSVIHFNNKAYHALEDFLSHNEISKIFIIVDDNTRKYCLEWLKAKLPQDLYFSLVQIPSGEEHKTIETCTMVWKALSNANADRMSLIINLGGGVVTDLGGFVASTYRRGIKFINIPTSLLAMVDASIGGKTGVDLDTLKNQIGVISLPQMVLIDADYLKTLPELHYRSGLGEMLKHGLIKDECYWNKMIENLTKDSKNKLELIYDSIIIKHEVVSEDPHEKGLRKTLNYGHTLGHAIESYFLDHSNYQALLHGDAIAIGLVLETYISHKLLGFELKKLNQVKSVIRELYGKVIITETDIEAIITLLKFDKKNAFGEVNFVLLKDFGDPKIDCKVDNTLIREAFAFYAS